MIRLLLLFSIALTLGACKRGPDPLMVDPGVEIMSIPRFTLTDQTGAQRSEAIFKHPGLTVLDFTFTSCPFICPPMNSNMLRLQRELEGLPVRFVSISVDPVRDTPEKLAQHAEAIGADTSRWTFLTGDFATVKRISHDGLKMLVGGGDDRVIELRGGETMANIPHSSKFVLVRGDGVPIAVFDGTNQEDVTRLANRIRMAF